MNAIQNYGKPAFAVCRCGHWDTEHHPQTGKCPVPNAESYWRFYEFAWEITTGEPHPTILGSMQP